MPFPAGAVCHAAQHRTAALSSSFSSTWMPVEFSLKMVARQCAREKTTKMKKRWKQNKKHAGMLLTISDFVEFKSPEFGDLPVVTLRALSDIWVSRCMQAIWMAINSESVTWLTNAIDWQYHNAAVTRSYVSCRHRTKARRSVAPIKDGSNNDDRHNYGNNDDDDQDDDASTLQGGDGNESGDNDNDEGGTGSDGSSEQAPQSSPVKVVDDEAGTVRGAVAASSSATEANIVARPAVSSSSGGATKQLTLTRMFKRSSE